MMKGNDITKWSDQRFYCFPYNKNPTAIFSVLCLSYREVYYQDIFRMYKMKPITIPGKENRCHFFEERLFMFKEYAIRNVLF